MAHSSTVAHANRKGKLGRVKGLHIKFLKSGGATSQTMHEPPADSPFMGDMPGEEVLHPSQGHLAKHVKSMGAPSFSSGTGMGGGASKSGEATQSASKPGPMNDGDGDEGDE